MKIYTYSNPFKLKEEKYWDEISSAPNLCVSQTLVQGLTSPGRNNYKREDYGYIYTIKDFNEILYRDWLDNPENDIKQFVDLSKEINQIENKNLRNTFKFNQSDVYNAIRLLIELDIKPNEMKKGHSLEMDIFIDIYDRLYGIDSWNILNNIKVDRDRIKNGFTELLNKEIGDIEDIYDNVIPTKTLNYLLRYKDNTEPIDKIIIHGVHRFEPIITRLVKDLNNVGIEVVFLINYMPEMERIYETWRRVYLWTGVDFIHGEDWGCEIDENLGTAIGALLEGEIIDYRSDNIKCIKFNNPTSFSDYVSRVYADAIVGMEGASKNQKLNRMMEQFYAIDNTLVNDILKQYYPEQFGNRHFLAYPIGQFILNLYNMWDDDSNEIKIDNRMFKECLSTGFFQREDKPNPVEVYCNIETYYEYFRLKDEHTLDNLLHKVKQLINTIKQIEKKEREKEQNSTLRRFSTYILTIEELEYLQEVLESIDSIVEKLLKENGTEFNFKDHFQQLINILEDHGISKSYISKDEKRTLSEIQYRLEKVKDTDLTGSIDDIKDSLHFYLNRINNESDESNWIVRNFEQLDGGVLLGRNTRRDRIYHLALIGNRDMNRCMRDLIPWPLDEQFFAESDFKSKKFDVFFNSYKEYRNFLRYSLFYSTYYLQNRINISYIENDGDKKNTLYFVLDLLGFKAEEFDDDRYLIYESKLKYDAGVKIMPSVGVEQLTYDEARNFLYCGYRYMMDELLDRGTNYESEYLQKLYYGTLVLVLSLKKLQNRSIDEIEKVVEQIDDNLGIYIHWHDIDSIDIQNKTIRRIKNEHIDDSSGNVKKLNERDKRYVEILEKFIYAKITDTYQEEAPNLIRKLHGAHKNISYYTNKVHSIINNEDELPKPDSDSVCEYCSQGDLCLYRFGRN